MQLSGIFKEAVSKAGPIFKPVVNAAVENSPKLLLAAGIGGFVCTVVMTAKVSGRVSDIHKKFDDTRDMAEEADKKALYLEEAKELAPHILPVAAIGAASIACFVGSSSVQAKRSAAVLAAYTALERTVDANREALVEKLGIEKADDILKDGEKRLALPPDTPPDESGDWFKDHLTGRFFKSDTLTIRMAESTVNKRLNSEITVPLAEFYYELGLDDDTPIGDIFGFESGRCPLDVHFVTVHPGTPLEYRQLYYRYVMVNMSMVGV